MIPRKLLLALLASPMFVPVSCTTAMLPAARGFSQLDARDLAAGEPAQAPLRVLLVDRTWPATALPVPVAEVPAMLERWPGLTPRLPARGATLGPDQEELTWRVLDDADGVQTVELQVMVSRETLTLHYRARETGVEPQAARRFLLWHGAAGFVVALAFALGLQRVMRRRQQREPDAGFSRYR